MSIIIVVALTIAIWAGFAVSLVPPFRAIDRSMDGNIQRPVLTLFGWVLYTLTTFAIVVGLTVLLWGSVIGHDHANVGDIRCQRYERYFNGKTTTEEWRTIACVEVAR